jgi:hypothetical protein
MQKTVLLIIVTSFIANFSYGQLSKGVWLFGGNASFSSLNNSSTVTVQYKQTNIQITPVVGYFLADKFAVGLCPSLIYGSNTVASTSTTLAIGPFTRYYFLNSENIFNLFAEGSYLYGSITNKGQASSNSNTFSISGGPVLYFNSSVALEFTLGYSMQKAVGFTGTNNEIRFGIGFKFNLEKEK